MGEEFVERIRELCSQWNTNFAEIERKLGIGNGIIARWKKSKPRADTLKKVADYFNVTVEYLTEGKKTPVPLKGDRLSDSQLMFALWGDSSEITQEDLDDVRRYAAFVAQRKKEKK